MRQHLGTNLQLFGNVLPLKAVCYVLTVYTPSWCSCCFLTFPRHKQSVSQDCLGCISGCTLHCSTVSHIWFYWTTGTLRLQTITTWCIATASFNVMSQVGCVILLHCLTVNFQSCEDHFCLSCIIAKSQFLQPSFFQTLITLWKKTFLFERQIWGSCWVCCYFTVSFSC
jgi:hypothetical protein